jgi:hypothetical protein
MYLYHFTSFWNARQILMSGIRYGHMPLEGKTPLYCVWLTRDGDAANQDWIREARNSSRALLQSYRATGQLTAASGAKEHDKSFVRLEVAISPRDKRLIPWKRLPRIIPINREWYGNLNMSCGGTGAWFAYVGAIHPNSITQLICAGKEYKLSGAEMPGKHARRAA